MTKHSISGNFAGGFTPKQIQEVEAKHLSKALLRTKKIKYVREDKTNHIVLQNALNIFSDIEDKHTPITLVNLVQTAHVLIDTETSHINLLVDKCLKSSIKIVITGYYTKTYWKKGPNFSKNRETIQDIKKVDVEETHRIKYGDFFDFTSGLFKALSGIIKDGQLIDPTQKETQPKDIWEFKF